jgi:hypothetical protein
MERMNLDILILLFVSIAVLFLRHKKSEIAVIFLLLSALIKFYTFPLAVITLLFIQNGKKRLLSAFLVFLTGTLLITEIVKIPRFPGTWYVSFGNQIVGQWWNLLISERNLNWYRANSILASLVGIAFILAGTLISHKIYGKSIQRISETLGKQIADRDVSALIYLYAIMILFICYFSGMNYDYRLFYLGIIPIVIYRVSRTEKYLFRTLVGVTLLSLWMSCFFYGLQGIRVVLLELAGDVFTGIAVSINLLLFIHVILAIWRMSKTAPLKI